MVGQLLLPVGYMFQLRRRKSKTKQNLFSSRDNLPLPVRLITYTCTHHFESIRDHYENIRIDFADKIL